jgi:ubiquitin thioesterase OTU1
VLENHDTSHATAKRLRDVISDAVKAQPDEYSEVVLGRPPDDYAQWIKKPESWGGGIELAILAKHYQTEIAAFDITTARYQIFGQEAGYRQRVLVIYDGIHYDPLALSFGKDLPAELDQTVQALLH